MRLLSGRILRPSRQSDFEERYTASLADIHANPSLSPASGRARTTPDTFGRILQQSCGQLSLFGASSRTSPDTCPLDSPPFIEAYETWVTKLRQDCLRRQSAARPTSGSGCSSWPTASEMDVKNPNPRVLRQGRAAYDNLSRAVQWGTPRVTTNGGTPCPEHTGKGSRLEDQVVMWPTPNVPNGGRQPAEGTVSLTGQSDKGKRQVGLHNAVTWPTASVTGNHNRKGASKTSGDGLSTAVKANVWPTPQASEYKGQSQRGQHSPEDRLTNMVMLTDGPQAPASLSTSGKSQGQRLWSTPQSDYPSDDVTKMTLSPAGKATRTDNGRMVQTSLTVQLGVQRNRLNSAWVEQLMGLPVGWTNPLCERIDFACWAMASCPPR